jgi:hypothetical protein
MCASHTTPQKQLQELEATLKETWIKIANPETVTHSVLIAASFVSSVYLIHRVLVNSPGTLLALESGEPNFFLVAGNVDLIQWLTGRIVKPYKDLSPETKAKVDEIAYKWAIIFSVLGISAMVFAGDTILDFAFNIPNMIGKIF